MHALAPLALAGVALAAAPACAQRATASGALRLPYAEAGLSEREAAAFLLDRLAFGPRPGEVDALVASGLERWIEEQLQGALPDPELDRRLAELDAVGRSLADLEATYLQNRPLLRAAQDAGVIAPDAERVTAEVMPALRRFVRERGLRRFNELRPQLVHQKVLRARYGRNQLREVLTDFWYNHFNVDARGGSVLAAFDYEREVIRPFALGRFHDLLAATARHPAMLNYLDNRVSRAAPGAPTALGTPSGPEGGLNENYARELMELHTLGVEGGYTQTDVEEVARAFTGWTVRPGPRQRERQGRRLERLRERARRAGTPFVEDGFFLFRPDWHDAGPKTVLGTPLPPGRGMEDGEDVLALLAAHPATARFLSHKLAVRFVEDDPDPALVERLAAVFSATEGDITAVMRALVQDEAFWQGAAGPSKVRTPFEFVMAALRATDAEVSGVRELAARLSAMGEPVFHAEPPTGFPDHAAAWVNAGALLNRMNFGLHLALGQVRGITADLPALNDDREPESAEAALETYAALLLPGRDLQETIALLTPVVREPDFATRVDDAARRAAPAPSMTMDDPAEDDDLFRPSDVPLTDPDDTLAFVVGVILGSPQFQRQ